MKLFIHKMAQRRKELSLGVVALLILLSIYLFFRRETRSITVRLKITDENVLYAQNYPRNEYAHSFLVGDTEKDELGRVTAQIVSIESYKLSQNIQVVYLDIQLKATYNPRKNIYTIRGKNIVFGESILFNFSKVRFRGLVTDSPVIQNDSRIKRKKVIVNTQLRYDNREFSDTYGVPEYLAYAVKKGDSIVNTKNDTLARVLEVNIVPAKRTTIDNFGAARIIEDPFLKDVYYTIELSSREINNTIYMFDFIPITIGQVMPLNFKNVDVWPTIIDIPSQP